MPPKKQQQPNKKIENKKKDKLVEDKTFGLKNKKGSKQQKYIQHVQHQVKFGGQSKAKLEAEKHEERKKKVAAGSDELGDLNKLLKPVQEMPKVGKDTMENWDEAKLSEVVEKKHGESEKLKPKTAIICKYFVEALESSKYGWFWECPNGERCIYRHALPQGYVLKRDKKKLDEFKEEEISLEDLIEKERAALGANLTRITFETFLEWKKRKLREKKDKRSAEESKKRNEYKAGRAVGLSGRDLFTFNPDLILEDDAEADDTRYEAEKDENEEDELEAVEIDETMFVIDEDGEFSEFGTSEPTENGNSNSAYGTIDEVPGSSAVVGFNEELFNPDELPCSDAESESSTEQTDGLCEGLSGIHLDGNNT